MSPRSNSPTTPPRGDQATEGIMAKSSNDEPHMVAPRGTLKYMDNVILKDVDISHRTPATPVYDQDDWGAKITDKAGRRVDPSKHSDWPIVNTFSPSVYTETTCQPSSLHRSTLKSSSISIPPAWGLAREPGQRHRTNKQARRARPSTAFCRGASTNHGGSSEPQAGSGCLFGTYVQGETW